MVTNTSLGSWVPSAIAPSSESTDAALGFALVAGAFNPVVEWAGRQVAGPPFPGTYVAVSPLAKNRQMAGTCEKGKARVSDSWLAATGILGCSGKAGQTAICKACHRGFLARASHRDDLWNCSWNTASKEPPQYWWVMVSPLLASPHFLALSLKIQYIIGPKRNSNIPECFG